jgi:hypothetical protein
MNGSLLDPSYTPSFKRPNPWIRVPLVILLGVALGYAGGYWATHSTTLDDKAQELAQSNVDDVLLTQVDPTRGEWAAARVAAREVQFQEDNSGCVITGETVVTGDSIAAAQMRAQAFLDNALIGTTAEVRAEYGIGYAIVPGVKQQSGDSYRYLPDRFIALINVVHCIPAEVSGPTGLGS